MDDQSKTTDPQAIAAGLCFGEQAAIRWLDPHGARREWSRRELYRQPPAGAFAVLRDKGIVTTTRKGVVMHSLTLLGQEVRAVMDREPANV